MPAFPGTARASAEGFSLSLSGIVGAGWDNNANYLDDFWQYDPASSNWIQLSNLPTTPRKGGAGFVANGLVYFGTGIDSGNNRLSDFWEYTPFTFVHENEFELDLKVYPNPVSDVLYIVQSQQTPFSIQLTDGSGKLLMQTTSSEIKTEIILKSFSEGIYFATISSKNKSIVKKIKVLRN